jgi:PleD family two-component response regulator
MRAIVKQVRLAAGGRQIHLTVSIGGTLVAPGDTPELMVARADALMYKSKNGGRDTVTLDAAPEPGSAPEPPPAPPRVLAL